MSRSLPMRCAAFAALTVLSCTSSPPAQPPAAAAPTPAPEPAPSSPTPRPDPGPRLSRHLAEGPDVELEPRTIQARSVSSDADHFHFTALLPEDLVTVGSIRVRGERYGVAAAYKDGPRFAVHVRLVGEQHPDETVELHLFGVSARRQGRPESRTGAGIIRVTDLAAAERDPALPRSFLGRFAQTLGGSDPFYSFATARLQRLGGAVSEARRPRHESDLDELMSLYTGLTSVEEALQTERGLQLRDRAQRPTLPLAGIEPVPLAAHPWDAMIDKLGKAPALEPLAAHVPADALYIHFHDLRRLMSLSRDLDGWGSALSQTLERRPGASHFIDRYEAMLAVERSGLAEAFGNVATDGVALVIGDPLLREGTDVSLVFRVENRALLVGTLDAFERAVRKRRPDASVTTYELGGKTVRLLATADRSVAQHRLELGDVLVLSNSFGAVRRFVEVASGSAPALAAAGDYRYMRALYPFDPEHEDGFAFMSDAFVARVTSPRFKILQARRVAARADLQAVSYAALLFGWLEGRPPNDSAELVRSGLLHERELRHADGAAISFTTEGSARSTWGSVASLTPIADLELERVTQSEREAYERFRAGYQRYWSTFIDPIGVRLARTTDASALIFDARMLPLIEATEYDEVVSTAGEAAFKPPQLDAGLQWTTAVGAQASLRRELERVATSFAGRQGLTLDWLGSWVALGAADRGGLWDLAIGTGMIRGADSNDPRGLTTILAGAPIYAAAEVKNPLALAALLTALRELANSAAPGLLLWEAGEPYGSVPTTIVRENRELMPGGGRAGPELALHYATRNGVFVASLDRGTLEEQLEALGAGRAPRGAQPAPGLRELTAAAQSGIHLAPRADGWLGKTIAALLESSAEVATLRAASAYEAVARGLGAAWSNDEPTARRLAVAYLGYEPLSPVGGAFSLSRDRAVEHTLYGSMLSPRALDFTRVDTALGRLVRRTTALVMSIGIEGEAEQRGLHTRVEWRRAPARP